MGMKPLRDYSGERLLRYERYLRHLGFRWITGVDEAGRGPLAGPVVAAAVILPAGVRIDGLRDSKLLTPRQRDELYDEIRRLAHAVGVGIVGPRTIDRVNIRQASFLAMRRALARLGVTPQLVLVDGDPIPLLPFPERAFVRADRRIAAVAAASVVAKVTRDRIMDRLDRAFPAYRFAEHKGYPTPEHLAALATFGPSPVHRLSYAPCRAAALQNRFDFPATRGSRA